MDIKQLARSLGVTQQPAISRAIELLRLLKLKAPGSLGQGEICRPAVCLELACQTTPGSKLPIREEFIRYSCSAPKVYNEMSTRIQRLLDVRPALDLQELVTIFGCSQLHNHVQQLLRTYRSRLLESLPAAERARADLSRPAFLAAAFLLIAKKHRASVDRAALTNKMGLTRTELASAMEDIAARCGDQLEPEGGSRKRRRAGGDGGAQAAANELPGPSSGTGGEGADGNEAAGGRTASGNAAKRGRRAATSRRRAEEEEENEEGADTVTAEDVAVEDLKLVLIGLAPAAGPGPGVGPDAAATGGSRKVRQRLVRKKQQQQPEEQPEEEGEQQQREEGHVAVE